MEEEEKEPELEKVTELTLRGEEEEKETEFIIDDPWGGGDRD